LLKKIINLYNKLCEIKFRFDLPIKKKIILFDDSHSKTLREIIKNKFNILKTRDDKEIYFWIFIKQIFFFDFRFITYCKNYIKFISPKILITFIDTNIDFYQLKDSFKDTHFISIQNGTRTPDWFKSKRMQSSHNLKCDHIFVFNKFYIKEYKKYISSNYHILGNFKNNIVQVNNTKNNNNFLLISEIQFRKNGELILSFKKKLMFFINMYISKANKKIHILLKNKYSPYQKKEINFYKKIFKTNCVFKKYLNCKQRYKTI
jgi:surface carbohydrate biosynthesis protein